jgi:hypothetical protein
MAQTTDFLLTLPVLMPTPPTATHTRLDGHRSPSMSSRTYSEVQETIMNIIDSVLDLLDDDDDDDDAIVESSTNTPTEAYDTHGSSLQ